MKQSTIFKLLWSFVAVCLFATMMSCSPSTGINIVKTVKVKKNTGCVAAHAKRTYKYR